MKGMLISMDRAETGKRGEDMVAAFMRKNGAAVTGRNYHSRFGEIDIIAETEEYIIFTEVKTRRENSMVSPAEAVTAEKQRRIILTAEKYLAETERLLQPRFDVAEVTVIKRPDGSDGFRLHYIKNAF